MHGADWKYWLEIKILPYKAIGFSVWHTSNAAIFFIKMLRLNEKQIMEIEKEGKSHIHIERKVFMTTII